MTELTKKGLVLSALPLLSLVVLAIFTPVFRVPSGVLLGIYSLFSLIPLSLLYLVYVLIRFIRFPKEDPAYQGVRSWSLIVGGLFFLPLIGSNLLGLLDLWLGWSDWLENLYVLIFVPYLFLPLICPIAEAVLYWKMRPYQI